MKEIIMFVNNINNPSYNIANVSRQITSEVNGKYCNELGQTNLDLYLLHIITNGSKFTS